MSATESVENKCRLAAQWKEPVTGQTVVADNNFLSAPRAHTRVHTRARWCFSENKLSLEIGFVSLFISVFVHFNLVPSVLSLLLCCSLLLSVCRPFVRVFCVVQKEMHRVAVRALLSILCH